VVFDRRHAVEVAKAILAKAGRDDLEIVKVSEITVVGREGNVMTVPAGDLEKIDAISREMRADDRHRKDPKAAERKRRQREKQRQRDGVTEAVTERDAERDSVTTAPASPDELDFQGGAHQALTH